MTTSGHTVRDLNQADINAHAVIERATDPLGGGAELLDHPVAPTDTELTGSTTPTKDAHA